MKIANYTDDIASYFDSIKTADRIILFGCGSKGRQAVDLLSSKGIVITACCDNNNALWGKTFVNGMTISNPREVLDVKDKCAVLITSAISNAISIIDGMKNYCEDNIVIYHFCNPFKIGLCLLPDEFVMENHSRLKQLRNSFCDEKSQEIWDGMLFYKSTGNMIPLTKYLDDYIEEYTFFDDDILKLNSETVYVDIGSYTGDSVSSFLMWSRGRYAHIIGYEPDKGNNKAINDYVKYSRLKNIDIRDEILWSKQEKLTWYTCDENNKDNFDSPNLYQNVDTIIDNKRDSISCAYQVWTNTLDKSLGEYIPTLIKINALAADHDIILGAENIIKEYAPSLIMEYGVKKEDVLVLLEDIINLNAKYRFYFRVKKVFGDIKVILYCV